MAFNGAFYCRWLHTVVYLRSETPVVIAGTEIYVTRAHLQVFYDLVSFLLKQDVNVNNYGTERVEFV